MPSERQKKIPRTALAIFIGIVVAGASFSAWADTKAAPRIAAAFAFTKVVDTNTKVPGGAGAYFSLNYTDSPAVSGGNVVFDTGDEVVWTATTSGGNLKRMITPNTLIPFGGGAKFQQVYGDYVSITGNTVVVLGDSCGGCSHGVGIYTRSVSGGPITRLVDTSEFIPVSTTQKYDVFPIDFHANGNNVVFQNTQQIFSVPLGGGKAVAVAGTQDGGFSPPAPYCCIFAQPTLSDPSSEVLLLGGNGFGTSQIQAVNRSGAPLSFRVIADASMHPPHTPSAYRFNNFNFGTPVIDRTFDHRYYVFRGLGTAPSSPNITGIYSRGSTGLHSLVDTNTPVPGGTGTFAPYDCCGRAGFEVMGAGNSVVVFRGIDAAQKAGLYAVSAGGGPITKIIAQGDPLNGFTVEPNPGLPIVMRRDGFDGTTLGFQVTYAGFRGRGIYTTQVVLP